MKNYETKKRYKMYKSGKNWIVAPLVFLGLAVGVNINNSNVSADTTAQSQATDSNQANTNQQEVVLSSENNKAEADSATKVTSENVANNQNSVSQNQVSDSEQSTEKVNQTNQSNTQNLTVQDQSNKSTNESTTFSNSTNNQSTANQQVSDVNNSSTNELVVTNAKYSTSVKSYAAVKTQVTNQVKNGWQQENGSWYYFNDGQQQKGWLQGGDDWYYFNNDGVMQTSWLQGGNDWYYFNPTSGRMQKSWLQGGKDWYYFNPTSGHMQKGWLQGGNDWYYFSPTSGHMQKGWLQGGNDWYYFNPVSGRMQRGYAYINGVNYNFSNSGRQILNYSIDYRYALPAGKGDDETAANNYLILHEVGTESGAATNARYFHDTVDTNEAYVTFVVGDGGKFYQVGRPGQVSWGAGRVANHNAPVQIELGRTYNSGQFWQDYVTYVRVARDMAGKYGIPLTLDAGSAGTRGIKSHYWVTKNIWGDHVDPYGYLSRFGVTQAKLAHDLLYGV